VNYKLFLANFKGNLFRTQSSQIEVGKLNIAVQGFDAIHFDLSPNPSLPLISSPLIGEKNLWYKSINYQKHLRLSAFYIQIYDFLKKSII
jgi:hypothetical protein